MAERLSDADVGLSSGPPAPAAGHLSDSDVGLLSDADVGLEQPKQEASFTDRINQVALAAQVVHAITNPAKGLGIVMHEATQALGGVIESEFPALKTAQQQGQILPLENMGSVIENALTLFGGGPAKMPEKDLAPAMKTIAPAVEDFITNVMQPAAEKFVAEAQKSLPTVATPEAEAAELEKNRQRAARGEKQIAEPISSRSMTAEEIAAADARNAEPAVPPLFQLVEACQRPRRSRSRASAGRNAE